MARRRIKDQENPSFYHITSRIVGKQPLLTPFWMQQFIDWMWRISDFCGIDIWTYCMMKTHVHIAAGTPSRQEVHELPDKELLRRIQLFKGLDSLVLIRLLEEFDRLGRLTESTRAPWLEMMGDLSVFMKFLKQFFSTEYNLVHDRFGTLWAERFCSQMHRPLTREHKSTMLYVELNAARARIVEDPKDYLYCGYGAAVRGDVRIQAKIQELMGLDNWEEAQAEYRKEIFVRGGFSGKADKADIPMEKVREVLRQGGKLDMSFLEQSGSEASAQAVEGSPEAKPGVQAEPEASSEEVGLNPVGATHNPEVTRSGAVGSYEYIQEVLKKNPQCQGPRRKGPVKLKGPGWEGLWGLKRVRPTPPRPYEDSG